MTNGWLQRPATAASSRRPRRSSAPCGSELILTLLYTFFTHALDLDRKFVTSYRAYSDIGKCSAELKIS